MYFVRQATWTMCVLSSKPRLWCTETNSVKTAAHYLKQFHSSTLKSIIMGLHRLFKANKLILCRGFVSHRRENFIRDQNQTPFHRVLLFSTASGKMTGKQRCAQWTKTGTTRRRPTQPERRAPGLVQPGFRRHWGDCFGGGLQEEGHLLFPHKLILLLGNYYSFCSMGKTI